MAEITIMQELANLLNIGSDMATIAILYFFWKLDRRVLVLELEAKNG